MQQELLTTFNGTLGAVALVPNHEGTGIFDVTLSSDGNTTQVVWSRLTEGRFPESKELKQRVRDIVAPEQGLGHSDSDDTAEDGMEQAGGGSGSGRSALQRLMDVLRGDRKARRESEKSE